MRQIASLTMDMNLSKLEEMAKDRGAWLAAVHADHRVGNDLVIEQELQKQISHLMMIV